MRSLISFKNRARTIDAGNTNTSFRKAIEMVFHSERMKSSSLNSSWNCLIPTQGLPQMPSSSRYSLNAMTLPSIG
jgi:hypothetical protein